MSKFETIGFSLRALERFLNPKIGKEICLDYDMGVLDAGWYTEEVYEILEEEFGDGMKVLCPDGDQEFPEGVDVLIVRLV